MLNYTILIGGSFGGKVGAVTSGLALPPTAAAVK